MQVLRFLAAITKEIPGMVIIEYCQHGRLSEFLVALRDPSRPPANQILPLSLRLKMMGDVASGMCFLAARGYVHKSLSAKCVRVCV
jgi:hypothetical protein